MSEWTDIRFGTAGTSDSFEAKGYKSSLDIPAYTAEMGLDAFEYQCGHGVRLGVDKAGKMAADAAERGILFSVHAPYYISMSSLEEEKRLGSVRYLLQSAEVCRALGGQAHHLPLGQLRQTEPRSRPRKGAGHHAPCRGSAGRSRLRRHDSLPGDHGQDRPAGYAGRSIGPLRGGQAHHALHRLRPPERPDAGRHPVQGRLRRHPRPDG